MKAGLSAVAVCDRDGCGHAAHVHEQRELHDLPGMCWRQGCGCVGFVEPLDLSARVALVVAQLGGWLEPVLEAVEGYRGKLQGMGYPADAAASMAADYHRLLLAAFTSDKRAEAEGG